MARRAYLESHPTSHTHDFVARSNHLHPLPPPTHQRHRVCSRATGFDERHRYLLLGAYHTLHPTPTPTPPSPEPAGGRRTTLQQTVRRPNAASGPCASDRLATPPLAPQPVYAYVHACLLFPLPQAQKQCLHSRHQPTNLPTYPPHPRPPLRRRSSVEQPLLVHKAFPRSTSTLGASLESPQLTSGAKPPIPRCADRYSLYQP